jgi:hypothetical protein
MKRQKIKILYLLPTGTLFCLFCHISYANKNPFSNLILTSIDMQTNIGGEKVSKLTIINSRFDQYQHRKRTSHYDKWARQIAKPATSNRYFIPGFTDNPWLNPPYYSTKLASKEKPDFTKAQKLYPNFEHLKTQHTIFSPSSILKTQDFIPPIANFDILKASQEPKNHDYNLQDWHPNLDAQAFNPFNPPEPSSAFTRISDNEKQGDKSSLQKLITKFTTIKTTPNTIVSSLNYNFSHGVGLDAQWQVVKPNKNSSKLRNYLTDTSSDRPVSLYSLAVHLMF